MHESATEGSANIVVQLKAGFLRAFLVGEKVVIGDRTKVFLKVIRLGEETVGPGLAVGKGGLERVDGDGFPLLDPDWPDQGSWRSGGLPRSRAGG